MIILNQTNKFLSILDRANFWLDWHLIFALCSLLFFSAAFGLYFNFWPLSFINRVRTDTFRDKYLSKRAQKFSKMGSFLAYGFAGTCFLSIWFFGLAQSYRIDFDRGLAKVTRTSIFFGDELITDSFDLDRVKSAGIETSKGNSKRLVLYLNSGEVFIPLGLSFTDQSGIDQAKEVINDFLESKL